MRNPLEEILDWALYKTAIEYDKKAMLNVDMEPGIVDGEGNLWDDYESFALDQSTLWKLQTVVKYVYWSIIPFKWRPSNILYRVKCGLWHKYTTIKPRTLGHTYVDKSELIPHLIFECLCRFVENQIDDVDWTWSLQQREARQTFMDAYEWWNNVYLKFLHEEDPKIWVEQQQRMEQELTEWCIKVLKYREDMWT